MAPHSTATTSPYTSTFPSSVDDRPGPPSCTSRPLIPGIYVPTPCFFHANEDVDTATIAHHTTRLARAGVAGITTQGSNGEAVHLSLAERALVTHTTRFALDAAGFPHVPVIVGCGAQSVRETISLCNQASESGGDYALVLPPSYYKAAMSRDALMAYFVAVADVSPVPLVVYNYPGAAAGTDLDSDFLLKLSQHRNVIGAKLTCGNVGKLARLAAATGAATPLDEDASSPSSSPFLVLAGSSDFLLPSLTVRASGALAGLANLAPKTHAALLKAFKVGDVARAQELQGVLARADWAVQKGGVVGTKYALQGAFGYGGFARAPLPRWGKGEVGENLRAFEEILAVEAGL
ncbi:MAG: dihydrodipicolinate synthase family protein [Janthinobacterium lividum]